MSSHLAVFDDRFSISSDLVEEIDVDVALSVVAWNVEGAHGGFFAVCKAGAGHGTNTDSIVALRTSLSLATGTAFAVSDDLRVGLRTFHLLHRRQVIIRVANTPGTDGGPQRASVAEHGPIGRVSHVELLLKRIQIVVGCYCRHFVVFFLIVVLI